MTYLEVVTNSLNPAWQDRVRAAIIAAAVAITQDSPSDPIDVRRDGFGRAVLHNPDYWVARFALPTALGFIAQADLTGPTDTNIFDRVAAVWNDLM